MLILLVLLCFFGCGFGGYYGNSNYGPYGGGGFGIGTILVIVLIFWLCGFRL